MMHGYLLPWLGIPKIPINFIHDLVDGVDVRGDYWTGNSTTSMRAAARSIRTKAGVELSTP
jgi:hypothetical protein